MTDVFVPVLPRPSRMLRAAELLGMRLLVLWMITLLVALPVSPAFAAETEGEGSMEDGESTEVTQETPMEEAEEETQPSTLNPEPSSDPVSSTDPRWGLGTNQAGVAPVLNENTEEESSSQDPESSEEEEEEETSPTLEQIQAKLSLQEIDALRSELLAQAKEQLREQTQAFQEEKQKFRDGCLNYEDGSFFCLNPDRENGPAAAAAGSTGTVYVQKDEAEGDGEIMFLPTGTETAIRLTDDIRDDQFPAISMDGQSVVWQSFIADRWQILHRDMATGAVEQLTTTPYNSMNPHVAGDMVVWQGWPSSAEASSGRPGNNWEVFVAERTQGTWNIRQLTDNSIHDMFPKVAGGFITWQTNEGNAWQVYAHELATDTTLQLSTGSAKHQNPRVALIWETQESDGSRRILSYDLGTGETAPVGSRPATPNPDELPQPPLADENATIPAEKTEEEAPTPDGNGSGDGEA
jgi:hypothetical protein